MKITFDIQEQEIGSFYKYIIRVLAFNGKQLHSYKVRSYSELRAVIQIMKVRYKNHLEIVRSMG